MSPAMTDALAGFAKTEFTHDGKTRTVYRAGSGPGVVVMSEMPGITPNVAAFAQRVVDAGFTIDRIDGGWDGQPVGAPDGELLVVARKIHR